MSVQQSQRSHCDLPVISKIATVSSKFWIDSKHSLNSRKGKGTQGSPKECSASWSIAQRTLSDLSKAAHFIYPGSRDGWEICERPLSVKWKTNIVNWKTVAEIAERPLTDQFYSWVCWASIERFGRDPAAMGRFGIAVINADAKLPIILLSIVFLKTSTSRSTA